MSWIQMLYDTYENCQSLVGNISEQNKVPLLPICHTTQMVQIEIAIDQDGNFKRAQVVQKSDARTIIPCTENSGGRAGIKPETHPLSDKLQYLSGDFNYYGGEVTKGFLKNPSEPYENYKKLLKHWCNSPYSHLKVKAILKYIEKGHIIRDLVDHKILYAGDDGKLLDKWDRKSDPNLPEYFKVWTNISQDNAFVRWLVEIPGDPQTAVWKDSDIIKSWIGFYESTKTETSLCYVTGKNIINAELHPSKLRNDGDKAKLISSNDLNGFTYRGRFTTSNEVFGIGLEITQKAHNALRWLISRQGYRRDSQAIVAWATTGETIPDPLADPAAMLGLNALANDTDPVVSTAQGLALNLKNKIAGYAAELGDTTDIVVMGIDSATPGRMAITYYRELTGSDFLNKINNWHTTCCWIHDYHTIEYVDNKTGKKKKTHIRFVGAPAPNDIAEAAYGAKLDEKLRKSTVERLLPCIIDSQKVPRDLVETLTHRAGNRVGMEDWEWNKTLSIACALYNKYYEKEGYTMALDENRETRDYLYGRLLALADSIEEWALHEAGEKRQTNAARLMQRFADHPFTTWRTIELSLEPYIARLGGKASKRQNLISEVMSLFEADDYSNDKRLSGEFLLGYHCQREALRSK